jgi:hypothetical protein
LEGCARKSLISFTEFKETCGAYLSGKNKSQRQLWDLLERYCN